MNPVMGVGSRYIKLVRARSGVAINNKKRQHDPIYLERGPSTFLLKRVGAGATRRSVQMHASQSELDGSRCSAGGGNSSNEIGPGIEIKRKKTKIETCFQCSVVERVQSAESNGSCKRSHVVSPTWFSCP